jgi:hypothetical protein
MGVSAKFCSEDFLKNSSTPGYSWYVTVWFAMVASYQQQNEMVQKVLLVVYGVIFGTFWLFEQLFGAAAAPTAFLATIVSIFVLILQKQERKDAGKRDHHVNSTTKCADTCKNTLNQ